MSAPFEGLHVLADDDPRWPRDPLEQGRAACAGGAAVVQLRVKHAGDAQALAWARALRALTRAAGAALVLNDRFDLALLAEADAVHLGQDDLPPARVRAVAGARLAIGRSTHTPEQLAAAAEEPIDYVAFGPVFGTTSKASAHAARGVAALGEAAARVAPRPLVAIGGIDAPRAAEVVRAGARGVAVIGAVAGAVDPVAATRALADAIRGAAAASR